MIKYLLRLLLTKTTKLLYKNVMIVQEALQLGLKIMENMLGWAQLLEKEQMHLILMFFLTISSKKMFKKPKI